MNSNERIMLQEIYKNSAQMYAFLARLFRVEIDETMLEHLKDSDFASAPDIPLISEGYQMMDAYLFGCRLCPYILGIWCTCRERSLSL